MTALHRIALSLTLAALAGCGSSSPSGTNDAGGGGAGGTTTGAGGGGGAAAGGSGGAAAGGAGGAAAGGSGGTASPIANFTGTWQLVSGTATISCSNGFSKTNVLTTNDVFAAGVSSDLVQTGDCPLKFNVVGTVATAIAGQSCPKQNDGTQVHISGDTFTTADGINGMESASGSIDGLVDAQSGAPLTCNISQTATYQRIAK